MQGRFAFDPHHSIEDCALALGEVMKAALGDKRGIARFGFTPPLDEALAHVTIDLSGRPCCVFKGNFLRLWWEECLAKWCRISFSPLRLLCRAIHFNVQGIIRII